MEVANFYIWEMGAVNFYIWEMGAVNFYIYQIVVANFYIWEMGSMATLLQIFLTAFSDLPAVTSSTMHSIQCLKAKTWRGKR